MKLDDIPGALWSYGSIARPHGRARIETSTSRFIADMPIAHRPASRPGAD